ncbi:unnamed protein product [Mytilus edulis]|uniref:Uncharacterized protein n=1 Tax=Mytilus edulis TaxID=6550 RepID=A0A8S3Q8P6_MYTED|nr:unnamed protein product [Mytilus edulis]
MDKLDIIQKSVLSHREEQEDSITELKEKFHTFETQIIKEHDKHKKVKSNVQDETAFSLNNILDKPKDINNNDQSIFIYLNITPSKPNSPQPYKSTTRQRDQPNQTTKRYDHQYNQYSTHEDRLTNERYRNYNNNRVNNIQHQPEFPQSPRFPQSQPFNMNNSQERPPFPQPQQFNMNTSQRQPFPQTTTFNMNNNLHRTPFLQPPPVNLPPLPFYPCPWGPFNQPSNQNGFSNYP